MASINTTTSNVEALYEDMFKEITRKFYGDETVNGMHTLGTPIAQLATTGPTAPDGERSFTNLQIDRTTQPTIEYDHNAVNGGGQATAGTGGASGSSTSATSVTVVQQNAAANAIMQQQQQQQQQQDNQGSVVVTGTGGGNFKAEDHHLNTAFGLAALMQQNVFATTTGNILNSHAINKAITTAAGTGAGAGAGVSGGVVVAGQQQQQDSQLTVAGGGGNDQHQQLVSLPLQPHQSQTTWNNEGGQQEQPPQQQLQPTTQIVQWTTTPSGKLQSYTTTTQSQGVVPTSTQGPQAQAQAHVTVTPKSKGKGRNNSPNSNNDYSSPSTSGTVCQQQQQSAGILTGINSTPSVNQNRKKNSNQNGQQQQQQQQQQQNGVQKRYVCTNCTYSTDRRDLFTRHENIHKAEKPFQCYVCIKQFNRADHVKKHFLRMHRDVPYDINKTRRNPGNLSVSQQYRIEKRAMIDAANNSRMDHQSFMDNQRQPTSSSLSIAETIEAVATAADEPLPQLKQEKNEDGSLVVVVDGSVSVGGGGGGGVIAARSRANNSAGSATKPQREKRFPCTYCSWSGADKWGLKRHMNTHTKPFMCTMCPYKAARTERLATHIIKMHSKLPCNKCPFLAESEDEFKDHLEHVHPHLVPSQRSNFNNNSNVLRTISNTIGNNCNNINNNNNNNNTIIINNSNNQSNNNHINNYNSSNIQHHHQPGIFQTDNFSSGSSSNQINNPEIIVNTTAMGGWRLSATGTLIPPPDLLTSGLPNAAVQKRGSDRLFQYLEADGSDTEDYTRLIKMDAISRNTSSVAQDFRKAGGEHELMFSTENDQLLLNNRLPISQATLLEYVKNAERFLREQQQQHQQQQQQELRQRQLLLQNQSFLNNGVHAGQHSSGEEDINTPSPVSSGNSCECVSPVTVTPSSSNNPDETVNSSVQMQCNTPTTGKEGFYELVCQNIRELESSKCNVINEAAGNGNANGNCNPDPFKVIFHPNNVKNVSNAVQHLLDVNGVERNETEGSLTGATIMTTAALLNNKMPDLREKDVHASVVDEENEEILEENAATKQEEEPVIQQNQDQFITSSPADKLIDFTNQIIPNRNQRVVPPAASTNTPIVPTLGAATNLFLPNLFKNFGCSPFNAGIFPYCIPHPLIGSTDLSNKENSEIAASFLLAQFEYVHSKKFGIHFQNYVQELIKKYCTAETLSEMFSPRYAAENLMPMNGVGVVQQSQTQTSPMQPKPNADNDDWLKCLRNRKEITFTIKRKSKAAPLQQQQQQQLQSQNQETGGGSAVTTRDRDLASCSHRNTNPRKNINNSISKETAAASKILKQFRAKKVTNRAPLKNASINELVTLLPLLGNVVPTNHQQSQPEEQANQIPLDFSKKRKFDETLDTVVEDVVMDRSASGSPQVDKVDKDDKAVQNEDSTGSLETEMGPTVVDKRNSRKQATPKRFCLTPESIIDLLRNKYRDQMKDRKLRKLRCLKCNESRKRSKQGGGRLSSHYHTEGSLALHRLWKHSKQVDKGCKLCKQSFSTMSSYKIHKMKGRCTNKNVKVMMAASDEQVKGQENCALANSKMECDESKPEPMDIIDTEEVTAKETTEASS